MANLKIQALKAKYQAQKLEALATIEVYLTNSVGIGEHPQIVEEMDKMIAQIEEADGRIETLNKYFVEDNNQVTGDQVGQVG
jgi:hypothetical protein